MAAVLNKSDDITRDSFWVCKLDINGDIIWVNQIYESLDKIQNIWDSNYMDILLCLTKKENFFGYNGKGDFELSNPKKNVSKIFLKENCAYAFTGLQIIYYK